MEDLKTVWDFVEKFYPDYHISDKVLHNEDLKKIISGEAVEGDEAYKKLQETYGNCPEEAVFDYDVSCKEIYEKAIQGFIDHMKDRVLIKWSINDVFIQATDDDVHLTEADALEVLKIVKAGFCANTGINWGVLSTAIRNYVNNKGLKP